LCPKNAFFEIKNHPFIIPIKPSATTLKPRENPRIIPLKPRIKPKIILKN